LVVAAVAVDNTLAAVAAQVDTDALYLVSPLVVDHRQNHLSVLPFRQTIP